MQTERTGIVGAILAGGKSSRMQRDKALLLIDEVTFIQKIANTLQRAFASVIIIANHDREYGFFGLPVYPDIFVRCGPLAGIHSALSNATTDYVFVAPCDIPFLQESHIDRIVAHSVGRDAALLLDTESQQTLCGMFHRRCLSVIEHHLQSGQHSVHACLHDLNTALLTSDSEQTGDALHPLTSINTPADYERALLVARHAKQGIQRRTTAGAR